MSKKKPDKAKTNNFVAKYAHQFNKALRFADKTKYTRKGKSKGLPFDLLVFQIYFNQPIYNSLNA